MSHQAVADRLLPPADLERVSRAIAALDTALCEDPRIRYYAYDPSWSEDERVATMDDGSGNTYAIVFGPDGALVRGFDHESWHSPWAREDGSLVPGMLDGMPDVFQPVIVHPDFRLDGGPVTDLTFCAWWPAGATGWAAGPLEDGDQSAERLFDVVLDGTPAGYLDYAAEYFEVDLDADVVAKAFELVPLSADELLALNPHADAVAVSAELTSQGYPSAAGQGSHP